MNLKQLSSKSWYLNYANWLPILQAFAWVLGTYLVAKIVWMWVLFFTTPTDVKPINVSAAPINQKVQSVDLGPLLNKNLFGVYQQEAEKVVEPTENVAPTRLNLKLRGIYAAETKTKANAIIEDNRGRQAVYFIDDKIEVSGRVYLRQVLADKVILETNGRREQLSLEKPELAIVMSEEKNFTDEPPKGKIKPSVKKQVNDKRKDSRLTKKLNDYRNKLLSDPKNVSDVISGSPHVVNGELQGFRIRPGRDRRLFQELGLRANDLVTAVNGVPLNNMQEAMGLMSDVGSMQEVTVDIQRGEQQLSLLLNLNNDQDFNDDQDFNNDQELNDDQN